MATAKDTAGTIQSVQRALDILDVFALRTPPLGISELADILGLHKSTVSGLVRTLQMNGYLEQDPATRRYYLGLKLIERAFVRLNQIEVRAVAMPHIERLRDSCNEDVNLVIPDGGFHIIYIERLLSSNSPNLRAEVGKRIHVHSSAAGKAILSCTSRAAVDRFIAAYGLTPYTEHTITDAGQLLQELEKIRDQGYAYDDEENTLGIRSVASPILNHAGEAVAAISIDLPVQRLPQSEVDALGRKVRQTAKSISLDLGYNPRPF